MDLKFPAWREFIEKESRFEQELNDNIGKRINDFSSKHPLIATTFQASLRLLPPPFDSIVEVIYDKFEGSDQEKLKEARKFLKELRTQGEDHYNMIASQNLPS